MRQAAGSPVDSDLQLLGWKKVDVNGEAGRGGCLRDATASLGSASQSPNWGAACKLVVSIERLSQRELTAQSKNP